MKLLLSAATAALLSYSAAHAASVTVTIGDNDGYGVGIADNGAASNGQLEDNRSAAEVSATDGSQFTDAYGALFVGDDRPHSVDSADIIFDFVGTLLSGWLTVDMGDLQADQATTPYTAAINGVAIPFDFQDGFMATRVRSYVLTTDMLAAANMSGQVILTIDRAGSNDLVWFDYFELSGTTSDAVVPIPAAAPLFAAGLAAFGARRRKKA